MSSFDAPPSSSASTRLGRVARRGSLALIAGAGAAALLTGCSSGQIAATAKTRPAVQGADARSGAIALQNLTVVYRGQANRVYDSGEDARLVVRIINSGHSADTLTSVSTTAAHGVVYINRNAPASPSTSASSSASPSTSSSASGSPSPDASAKAPSDGQTRFRLTVRPGQFAALVPDQGQYLQIDELKHKLVPGQSVHLVFHFEHAGAIAVDVPMAPPSEVNARTTAPGSESSSSEEND
ncbi:MAG: hypothetical protein WCA46_17595 [Actinocatenispora sp.]